MDENMKEVEFVLYCNLCECKTLDEDKDPCRDCLDIPARKDSHKPEYFKEKG